MLRRLIFLSPHPQNPTDTIAARLHPKVVTDPLHRIRQRSLSASIASMGHHTARRQQHPVLPQDSHLCPDIPPPRLDLNPRSHAATKARPLPWYTPTGSIHPHISITNASHPDVSAPHDFPSQQEMHTRANIMIPQSSRPPPPTLTSPSQFKPRTKKPKPPPPAPDTFTTPAPSRAFSRMGDIRILSRPRWRTLSLSMSLSPLRV
ncbi:hypothetical protein R3P38DRAFT_3211282 [Favolaschia claudopus]|uniref:Uncharacterized protein n=1 Tax=Favolaschia claudopus TaxID=2862362 RepID=A0AAW0AGA6_9AGAR